MARTRSFFFLPRTKTNTNDISRVRPLMRTSLINGGTIIPSIDEKTGFLSIAVCCSIALRACSTRHACHSSVIYIVRDSETKETNKTNTRAREYSHSVQPLGLCDTPQPIYRIRDSGITRSGEDRAVEVAFRALLLEIFEFFLFF